MYKLKQFVYDTSYIIVCPSKDTTLNFNTYAQYAYIPSLFKIDGYGKRRKLYTYSYHKIFGEVKLKKCGLACNIAIVRWNFGTIKQLSPFECSKVGALLREKGFVFNRKTNVLVKLT